MLNDIEAMKRKEILNQHPSAISKMTLKNGKEVYGTYLHLPNGERKFRRRNTLKELEDCIIEFYKEQQEDRTMDTVFKEWQDFRLEYKEIKKETYDRYSDAYEQFFHTNKYSITSKKFKDITEEDLEIFIKSVIRDLSLTHKAYSNMRTLILGTFKYGKRKKYTSLSISHFFGDLDLSKNIFRQRIIEKEKEVFMEDEIPVVLDYLRKHPDIYNLGILLVFQTGLRVGELSALKASDIQKQSIKVRRTEVKYRDENGKWKVKVEDHTKTEAGTRDVIIPTTALETIEAIKKLNPNGEYLFESYKRRIRGNTFNKRVSAICDKLEMPHRTIHKVRKTYGTTLLDNDVDEAFVKEQMGHSDIATTRKLYYFSNKAEKNKKEQIEKAVCF